MKKAVLMSLAVGFLLSGCSAVVVQPWEREKLSRESMAVDGPTPMLGSFEEHIRSSKEGSRGGFGVSGGGCGCN